MEDAGAGAAPGLRSPEERAGVVPADGASTRAEQRRGTRILRMLSECNQALLRAGEEAVLLQEICRVIVEVGGYRLAWVGAVDEGPERRVCAAAQVGDDTGYLAVARISWADDEWGRGPTGTAIRTGRPQVVRHIPTDPNYAPWRRSAGERGYASSMALPLVVSGRMFGALNIYAREPDAFDTGEVSLLEELAGDLAFGLTALRTRADRDRSRERFETALAAMSDGILVTDGAWRVTQTNRAACLLLHLGDSPCSGQTLAEVLAPFHLSVPVSALLAAAEPVTAFEIARPRTTPPLFLDARLTRLFDAPGRMAGTVVIVRDVTQERRERRIQATFLAMVSHKFFTPLTILSGYLDLLRDCPPESPIGEARDMLQVCSDESRRLADLVRKLVGAKGAHAGLPAAAAESAVVLQAVTAVGESLRDRYPEKSLVLSVDCSPEAVAAVPGAHLDLVLERLLDNAAKFCDRDPVRVGVSVESAGDGWLRFQVSDNGPGIPHEQYDRIFSGFSQVEEDFTGQVPGLGVGLFIARSVVEAYGGKIGVHSRLGEGTTLWFTLPAAAV